MAIPQNNKMLTESRFVLLCYVAMIVSNILASATDLYNNTNNMKISKENPTVLTPDGVTFAVWGPIYGFLFITVVYQLWPRAIITQNTRNWLSLAFLLNAAWLPFFAYHLWWLSLLAIVAYAYTLYKVYLIIGVQYDSPISIKYKLCGYVGVSMNLAWVVVATFLNVGIVFRNSNIVTSTNGKTTVGGNPDWAIACICVVTGIAIYQLTEHFDFVYALTTSWALFGVFKMQTGEETIWALSMAITLCVVSGIVIGFLVYDRCRGKKVPTNELEQSLTA